MQTALHKKLQTQENYHSEEIQWLLAHIGDPDGVIRDELVYQSFGRALLEQRMALGDFQWLVHEVLERNLLFFQLEEQGQATLTRSFTALLLALLLDVDQQDGYDYTLTEDQRQRIFSDAIRYLHTETDSTGWSEVFGWVHAIAHGADLLFFTGLHSAFPKERMPQILESILKVLRQQTAVFSAGEEKRLARVLVQLLLSEKVSENQLCHWLQNSHFPNETAQEYQTYLNLENMLLAIYFELDREKELSQHLKEHLSALIQ